MIGYDGQNCDGHQYFAKLGDDLIGTVLPEHQHARPYYYGLVRVAPDRLPAEVALIQKKYQVPWVEGTILASASRQYQLHPFIEAIKQHKRVLYVGPSHLRSFFWHELEFWYLGRPGSAYHEIPDKNCYLRLDETLDHVGSQIRLSQITLVLLSASMMSNVLIHRLWPEFGDRVTMIDVGSLFDGFAGVYSRKYMQQKEWQDKRGINLYGHQHTQT